jgi:3-dehydroquinate synthase
MMRGCLVQFETQSFVVRSHRGEYAVRRQPIKSVLSSGLLPSDRLIVDEAVQELHSVIKTLVPASQTLSVVADETLKSLDGAALILSWLLESGFNRGGTLYVVGGGTVQDAASFVASIFHRGVRWTFIPTTLLAQGDSCIGSKSSINYGGYKNQLGTFYPPAEILIDEAFLETLAPQEVRSGIGEMLHYAVLGGEAAFRSCEVALASGWEQLSTSEMTALAMRALTVKRAFIEADEFDTNIRKSLNFGHTFGHGLEFASGGQIPHGIAVAYGIDLANAYAVQRGILSPITRERVGRIIRGLVDGSELRLVSAPRVLDGMSSDKKRSNNDVKLILIENLGMPVGVEVPLDAHLGLFLERYLDR